MYIYLIMTIMMCGIRALQFVTELKEASSSKLFHKTLPPICQQNHRPHNYVGELEVMILPNCPTKLTVNLEVYFVEQFEATATDSPHTFYRQNSTVHYWVSIQQLTQQKK